MTLGGPADEAEIAALTRAFATGWPAERILHDGAWRAQADLAPTNRNNSLLALAPVDLADWPRAVALAEQLGRPPQVMATPLLSAALLAQLPRRDSLTDVMTAPANPGAAYDCAGPEPDWAALCLGAAARRAVVARIAAPTLRLAWYADGRLASGALMVIAGDVATLSAVETAPEMRRQGYGAALTRGALAAAAAHGARIVALQVEADNAPALALYRKFGFTRRYSYTYARP